MPNDQYLCIIPDRKTSTKNDLFLPFEGDKELSIVLSKAFLLADDENIDYSLLAFNAFLSFLFIKSKLTNKAKLIKKNEPTFAASNKSLINKKA